MGRLSLAVLGTPAICHDGRFVSLPTRKTMALLVYLAVEDGLHSREKLAALLWPNSDAHHSRGSLRRTLAFLHAALSETAADHGPRHVVGTSGLVGLAASSEVDLDLLDLQAAFSLARGPSHVPAAQMISQLRTAANLFRGEFLEGFSLDDAPGFEHWADVQREACHRRTEMVYDRFSEALFEGGELDEAIEATTRWLSMDRLNEAAHRRLIRLRFAAGDRAAAVRAYEACRSVLEAELGAEPAPETETLAQRLWTAAPLDTEPRTAEQVVALIAADAPLVGRAAEHSQLVAAYRSVERDRAQLASIEGEPGIGKTRLASEFLRWAGAQGADVLFGRAFEAAGRMPYQPLVDALRPRVERENAPEDLLSDVWLAELSRLLPELRDRYPDLTGAPGDDGAARTRLFEAVSRLVLAFARRSPVVLWLDDLQWADAASLDLLQFASRRWARAPVLLLLCFRSDDLSTNPALTAWQAALAREVPLLRLTLRPLTSEDTERLVRGLRGPGPAHERDTPAVSVPRAPNPVLEAVGRRLFAETGGHPFFLVETVRALLERGILQVDALDGSLTPLDFRWADGPRDGLPPSAHELIHGRLTHLSAAGRSLIFAAAVLGQGFAYEQLHRVADVDEAHALPALDELLIRGLLLETDGQYGFAHDRIREVAYTETSDARRRLYHRRALSVLQTAQAPNAELLRHALAAHLRAEAFRFSVATGDDAMRLFAARDAIDHYEQALQLADQGSLGVAGGAGRTTGQISSEDRHHLYLQLARAYELVAEYARARAVYEALLTWAQATHEPVVECAALNRLARLAETDQLDVEVQASLLDRALFIARASGDGVGMGETEWNLSRLSLYRLDLEAGRAHAERALALAHEHGQPEHVARTRNWLSIVELLAGRYEDAQAHAEAARAAYAVLGDRVMEADSLVQMAAARTRSGQPMAGVAAARTAQALSLEIDNRAGQADAAKELALALLESGNYEEALEAARAGVAATRAAGDVRTVLVLSLAYLGSIHRHLGDLELARAVHEEGWAICQAVNIPIFTELLAAELCADSAESGEWAEAYAFACRASLTRSHPAVYLGQTRWYETEAFVRAGEIDRAAHDLRRLGEQIGPNRRQRIRYLRALAVLAQARGDVAEAIGHLGEARGFAAAIGLPGDLWEIHARLAELHRTRGDLTAALAASVEAVRTVQALAARIEDERLRTAFLAAAPVRRVFN